MAGSDRVVTFYFGLGSRYSYLAATQINRIIEETGAHFDWRPIVSGTLTASHENAPFIWDAASQDWSGAKVSGQYREQYRQKDLTRWAEFYGVPYQEPTTPEMDTSRRTFYCVAAAMLGAGQAYSELMFDAIYVKGRAIDEDQCRSFADKVNLGAAQLRALIDSDSVEETHSEWIASALNQGVFGVPTFVYRNEIFWGNDRLPLLMSALK